jgi:hypothetical protein
MGQIVSEVRTLHLDAHPNEEEILRPFLNGFDVTWGRQRFIRNTTLSVYILKPESHMAETFGFNQEVLLIYSEYPTLEARTMQAADQFINDDPGKGRVEKLTYFLISKMPNAEEWVRAYEASNYESRLVVSFSANELVAAKADAWFVRNKIGAQLFSRDLFDFRLPLEKDTYFFGREDYLMDYLDAAHRGENRGVFGLRKTGKTSFLFRLERSLTDDGTGKVIFLDCKSPSIRQLRWHELLVAISARIAKSLGVEFVEPSDTRLIADNFTELLAKIPDGTRVTVIFDEIEYISPFAIDDKQWGKDYVPFWQTIWAAQSRHRRLEVIIAGVNPSIVEVDKIGGVQNPLFGIVSYKYLRGLSLPDTRRMLRVLGRRMGLRFSEKGIDYIHRRYGGHPLLTRLACSIVHKVEVSKNSIRPVDLNDEELAKAESGRDAELSFYCGHVVSEIRDFYPREYELLEMLALGQRSKFQSEAVYPEFSRHLREYGLLDDSDASAPTIAIPVVGRFIALEEARRAGRQTIMSVVPSAERVYWLKERVGAILRDFPEVERGARTAGLTPLFGPNSFPESYKFANLVVVRSEVEFENMMNVCNRCFVESIEQYGRSVKNENYFWRDIRSNYPTLWDALHRVKTYRHNRVHLRLNQNAEISLKDYVKRDLEGREPGTVEDVWFVLQQCVLDGLLIGLQSEISRLSR